VQRQQEFQELIMSWAGVVREKNLDVVLIPGDLWDAERLDRHQLDTFRVLYTELCNMPVPVVIAPGNHDFYSISSFYHPDVLRAHGFEPWPEHVVIFNQPGFTSQWLPGWEGRVRITGRAFHDNTLNTPSGSDSEHAQERLLAKLDPCGPSEELQLLLFHGSRDDYHPALHKMTAPFSTSELVALNYDYVAVGHYHQHEAFTDPHGAVRGAYSGCPFARGLDETGPKTVIVGEIVKDGTSLAQVSLERVTLDDRQIVYRYIPITGKDTVEGIEALLLGDLNYHARAQDMIYCELQGQIPAGIQLDWERLEATFNNLFFHVTLDHSRVMPAYDLDYYRQDPHSLEGRYIEAMETKLAEAETEAQRERLTQALYLGLDALTGMQVRQP
jgi:DNA repair exonuclease SbcCD nuclease subunit